MENDTIDTNEKFSKKLDKYLSKQFGKESSVLKTFSFDNQQIQIIKFASTKKRDYQILATKGLSSFKMNVPQKAAKLKLDRAELVIRVPKDWNFTENNSEISTNKNWQVNALQESALLPLQENSWLHWSKIMPNGNFQPYSQNTKLCGSILIKPIFLKRGAEFCKLSKTDDINFYELLPLYKEEIEFYEKNNAEKLLTKLGGYIVLPPDENRMNICADDEDAATE